jgi:hypothetical protein
MAPQEGWTSSPSIVRGGARRKDAAGAVQLKGEVVMTHHEEKHDEVEEAQEDIELSEEQSDDVKGGSDVVLKRGIDTEPPRVTKPSP